VKGHAAIAATIDQWRAERPAGAARSPALDQALAAGRPESPSAEAELAATLDLLDALGVDADTLAATVLGADPDADRAIPARLVPLVDGQREAEKVWALHRERGRGDPEGLRRLLLAIIRDLRVVFILLARQLVRLRRAAQAPEDERRALAELTADIHAPLANRLGIWQVKWEMEDLCFRYLQPETYRRIAALLDERRDDRERWIEQTKTELRRALARAGLDAEVSGRPKHIFSIWKKMQRKQAGFEHLYDIRAVRVLVADVPTCYAALGVVHQLWPNVPGEFDDYIARPKGNDYRSLHTAVIGPEGKTLEVQIRTHEMHAHAELGVAAHWRYKEGGGGDQAFERKIAEMRRLLEARGDAENDAAFMAGVETELIDDRVYVLTPKGQVVDLPRGATVLDFAYHVHTEVGHRCRGAKVNGRIVPLGFQPSSGDTIEIITAKESMPRRDWITRGQTFLATPRAREKVRAWFRHADHARNVAAGREILERELRRTAQSGADLAPVLERFRLRSEEDLLVAVGIGEISASQVARTLHEAEAPKPARPLESAAPPRPPKPQGGVAIQGVGNLLHVLARCCQPLPGDPVAGYLTRGRGVSIHRADCRSLAHLVARDPSRLVQVEWGRRDEAGYEVNIEVRAWDRKALLKDVSAAISAADVDVIAASTRTDPDRGEALLTFALRVSDFGQLSGLLARIQALPNVLDARRVLTEKPNRPQGRGARR
jgi:GTP pyrophosphokinase